MTQRKPKKRVLISREKFADAMEKAKVFSYEALIVELQRQDVNCSYPTVMRWNSEGWPPWELGVLCDLLECKTSDLEQ